MTFAWHVNTCIDNKRGFENWSTRSRGKLHVERAIFRRSKSLLFNFSSLDEYKWSIYILFFNLFLSNKKKKIQWKKEGTKNMWKEWKISENFVWKLIRTIEDVQSIWIVINERMDFQGLGIAREIRDSTYPTICQHPIRTVNLYVFGHDLNPSRDVWRGCRLKRINVCQPSFRRMDVHVCLDMCVYTRVSIGNAFLDCNLRWWFLFVRSLNKIGGGDKQFLNVKEFFSIEKLGK